MLFQCICIAIIYVHAIRSSPHPSESLQLGDLGDTLISAGYYMYCVQGLKNSYFVKFTLYGIGAEPVTKVLTGPIMNLFAPVRFSVSDQSISEPYGSRFTEFYSDPNRPEARQHYLY